MSRPSFKIPRDIHKLIPMTVRDLRVIAVFCDGEGLHNAAKRLRDLADGWQRIHEPPKRGRPRRPVTHFS
jgi:hypothetical protein